MYDNIVKLLLKLKKHKTRTLILVKKKGKITILKA
jgi:hypothetical protein